MKYEPANSGLVKIYSKSEDYTDDQLASLQTLSDVMATGYHAALNAEVKPGYTIAVIEDGAVGLAGVIGAKLLGAEKIILLSHHDDRAQLDKEFGAIYVVSSRDEQAGQIARPGAVIGRVGVPHAEPKSNQLFWKNLGLRGPIASVTKPNKEVLLQAVLDGKINPGKVFTKSFDLDHIQEAYEAMSNREAIKSLIIVNNK